ncbi:cytochrome d ubiquinol oxidase subunit II [Janthinobacterium sp. GB4P2]|uniref:cytochrome d ubiquinol oxidase subunit II n=1 Tax=Janthinobacterium sp. GB4P2 TaxID=3424189 RepID=UPI003F23A1DD
MYFAVFGKGIGSLHPFFQEKSECDVMMNTAAPVWDGNGTWLLPGVIASSACGRR